jgi:predicted dehydrogenase
MIRFGVLGTAQITPAALVYPCMNEPLARISVIAARDRGKAEAFAAAHHIRTVCDSYSDVVNHEKINALYNPLHISAHHPWTISALNAGKHVLCEKSLACNAAEAREMNQVAKDKRLVLMDAFHYRYHPLFARMKNIVDSGKLGIIESIDAAFHIPVRDPDNIRMNYHLGGGVTMDIGCYPISWIRHLAGREPTVVSATAEVGPPQVDLFLETKMEAGNIAITTSADMRASASFKAAVTVRGSRGEMRVDNVIAPQMGHLLSLNVSGHTSHETVDRRPTYAYQLDAFIAAVKKDEPLWTDGDDAVAQMTVIDRCYEAAGLPIRGLEL